MSGNHSSILIRVGLIAGVCFDLYCMQKAIFLGLGGDPGMKKWFVLFFGVMIINLILGFAYYIQRAKPPKSHEELEVEALAAMGAQMSKEKARKK